MGLMLSCQGPAGWRLEVTERLGLGYTIAFCCESGGDILFYGRAEDEFGFIHSKCCSESSVLDPVWSGKESMA